MLFAKTRGKTWTHGIDMESCYRHGLMIKTWTLGIDMDSLYRHGLMAMTWTHGIDMDSWSELLKAGKEVNLSDGLGNKHIYFI